MSQNANSDLESLPLFSQTTAHTKSLEDKKTTPTCLTVTELTHKIRGTLEPTFLDIWVQGEISNTRPAASGHIYFSLKDEGASISAALFGWGTKKRLQFSIKDGLQILCHGKISVYAPRGSYQLIVDRIEPLGAGALQLAFEQLKARLAEEGLFDPTKKKTLPTFPSQIAVITSPTGAAIRDILNILGRRAPQVRVVIIPALVQGDEAPTQLIRGLTLVQKHALGEVVILARGGGSIEDLWCFNDESLARAIAASKLPIISAVGHEIDFTISDFVADLRAPTPSAAAELVTSHWVDAIRLVRDTRERLRQALLRELSLRKTLLHHLSARVISPRDRLREQAQKCDELSLRLERGVRVKWERKRALLDHWAGTLDALSPLRVLERGFSLVRDPLHGNQIIRRASEVREGQELCVTFHDGTKKVLAIS